MAKKKGWRDFGELTEADLKAMQLTEADWKELFLQAEADLKELFMQATDLEKADKLLENLSMGWKGDENKMNNSLEDKNKLKVGNNCEILTVKETADFLKIPISTVYQWTMRKTLPVCKMGRLNRYRKADLINFITQNMQSM